MSQLFRILGDVSLQPQKRSLAAHQVIETLILPKTTTPTQVLVNPSARPTFPRLDLQEHLIPRNSTHQQVNVIRHNDKVSEQVAFSVEATQRFRHNQGAPRIAKRATPLAGIELRFQVFREAPEILLLLL
ncbi:hypothetical protein WKV53_15015 [Luteolibacter sp. Y139]|uniref:Uncharacterized protein n=1 Tax=Luteolibacter soli TaxID=3135280 RepID=A0ABU9AVP6_9BACT